jgi:pectinesterase
MLGSSSRAQFWAATLSLPVGPSGVHLNLGMSLPSIVAVRYTDSLFHQHGPRVSRTTYHLPFLLTQKTIRSTFAEYKNTGAGASGTRPSFATQLSSAVSISTVLGSTSWIDSAWL